MKIISESPGGNKREIILKGETKHIQKTGSGKWMYCTSYQIKDGKVISREFATVGEKDG